MNKKTIAVILTSSILLALIAYGVFQNNTTVYAQEHINIKNPVYLSSNAEKYIMKNQIAAISPEVISFNIDSIPQIKEKGMIIFTVNEIKNANVLMNLITATKNTNSFAIILLNPSLNKDSSEFAIETTFKLYGSRNLMPLLPFDPSLNITDKKEAPQIHPKLFTSIIVAFTINPIGTIIIEQSKNFIEDISLISEWYSEENLQKTFIPSIDVYGFNYIGYIGWKTATMTGQGCGETTGYMSVKVNYYFAKSGIYRFWLAHVQHAAKGYKTTCWLWTWNHYPKKYISETNWQTSTWAGQVLDDWGPKNMGTSQTISFQLTAGVTLGYKAASASIGYSIGYTEPNTPYFEYGDMSDPPSGVAKAFHNINLPKGYDESKLNNILFTVEPSSIGLLDPNKPGGYLPMIVQHYFYTELNTGDSANISFTVYLWETYVS